jgi:hypothetical protein
MPGQSEAPSEQFKNALKHVFGGNLLAGLGDEGAATHAQRAEHAKRVFGENGLRIPSAELPPALRVRPGQIPVLLLLGRSFTANNGKNACWLNALSFVLCAFDNTSFAEDLRVRTDGLKGALFDVQANIREINPDLGGTLWEGVFNACVDEKYQQCYNMVYTNYKRGAYNDPRVLLERLSKAFGDRVAFGGFNSMTDVFKKLKKTLAGSVLVETSLSKEVIEFMKLRFFAKGGLGPEHVLLGVVYYNGAKHFAAFVRTLTASASPKYDTWAHFDAMTAQYHHFGVADTFGFDQMIREMNSKTRVVLYFDVVPHPRATQLPEPNFIVIE